jgi:predicted RNase H-like HicB family nuclease
MRYKVELTQMERGWYVECSDLRGCWSQGDAEDEALQNIKLAIEKWIAFAAKAKAGQYVDTVDIDI